MKREFIDYAEALDDADAENGRPRLTEEAIVEQVACVYLNPRQALGVLVWVTLHRAGLLRIRKEGALAWSLRIARACIARLASFLMWWCGIVALIGLIMLGLAVVMMAYRDENPATVAAILILLGIPAWKLSCK